MFKNQLIATILHFLSYNLLAQTVIPGIEWQKCIGGTGSESVFSIINTKDNGYIYLGMTSSIDGDLQGLPDNSLDGDYWVVKLTSTGSIEWQKQIGGSSFDAPRSVVQTSDGGYVVLGYSASNDGDVTCKQDLFDDLWMLKLSSKGDVLWQKCLGGSNHDLATSLAVTADGGFAVLGTVYSNDGDVSGNHGGHDIWVVKLSTTGTIQWQKCLGGSSDERGNSIKQTIDGGYIIAGNTNSTDGDVSGNHGNLDAWVVKLSPLGTIQWQKCLGGRDVDIALSVIQTNDGGYAFAGETQSVDGDVIGNHGAYGDAWVVKLSATGAIEWQKCLGGSLQDRTNSIFQVNDGGYMVAGYTYSKDGDITTIYNENFTSYDAWVVKLSAKGDLQWQKSLGGKANEEFSTILPTPDGGYLAAGLTSSNDFDVRGHHGGTDAWLVKLSSDLKIIIGRVQQYTASCQPLFAPVFLGNMQVKIENNGNAYYTSVDSLGRFGVLADTGRFIVSAIPPNNLWSNCSPEVITISKPGIRDTTFVNPSLFANSLCPFMEVELTTPFLRRCFESQYTIHFANRGTAVQKDAIVELTLDSMLTFVSATRPVYSRIGNKISFSIGNVGINQFGQFDVTVLVSCDSRLGQAHCSSVMIPKTMPCDSIRDTIPTIINQCVSGCDSLLFLIKKPASVQNKSFLYRLIADASVIDTGRFVWSKDVSWKHKKDERTYRLELRNTFNQIVAAQSIESTVSTPSVSTGFATQFSSAIKLPHQAENCTANRGSYDPNDKSTHPMGVGVNHFIEQGTTVEYLVRFQNTGTDTAFKVLVKDTLSPYFNFSTLKNLGTSHTATWQLNPNGILTYTFNNINLVDSFTNEKQSHGFFRYQIQLKDSVATGTHIDNKAAIYFDFNPPIITNVIYHTVGKEFLKNCLAIPAVSIKATGCPSKNIEFNAIAKNGGLNPTFAWFRNNETIPIGTNTLLTLNNVTNGTKIYCKMTASSDLCTEKPIALSDTFKINCINTNTDNILSNVELFEISPNPNKGIFEVTLTLLKSAQLEISILNALGQILKTQKEQMANFVEEYDISQLPNGIYFVKVTIDGQSVMKKVLKYRSFP